MTWWPWTPLYLSGSRMSPQFISTSLMCQLHYLTTPALFWIGVGAPCWGRGGIEMGLVWSPPPHTTPPPFWWVAGLVQSFFPSLSHLFSGQIFLLEFRPLNEFFHAWCCGGFGGGGWPPSISRVGTPTTFPCSLKPISPCANCPRPGKVCKAYEVHASSGVERFLPYHTYVMWLFPRSRLGALRRQPALLCPLWTTSPNIFFEPASWTTKLSSTKQNIPGTLPEIKHANMCEIALWPATTIQLNLKPPKTIHFFTCQPWLGPLWRVGWWRLPRSKNHLHVANEVFSNLWAGGGMQKQCNEDQGINKRKRSPNKLRKNINEGRMIKINKITIGKWQQLHKYPSVLARGGTDCSNSWRGPPPRLWKAPFLWKKRMRWQDIDIIKDFLDLRPGEGLCQLGLTFPFFIQPLLHLIST